MNTKLMKKILSALLILTLIPLSGCWDSREMNELGLVVAVGIDKAPNSCNYVVTVQMANPKSTSLQGSGTSGSEEAVIVLSAEGKTLFDAIRELAKVSSKRIMWAHDFIVIIGESVARDSIAPVVDFFTHNPELRMKTPVVVSEGNAIDYLAIKSGMEDIPGVSFASTYAYARLTAEYIETSMLSLCQEYYGSDSQPIISKISFKKSKLKPGDQKPQDMMDQVQFGGAAVFIKDKLIGWLSPEETRGLAWVLNQTRDTLVIVPEPDAPDKYASVETHDVSAKIETEFNDGKPSAFIAISGKGSITEEDTSTNLPMEQFKKTLEGFVDSSIGNTIQMSLDKLQKDYRCDALGFARYFHVQHFDEWESGMKDKWEELYPQLQVSVKVDIDINESTLNQIPENNIAKK